MQANSNDSNQTTTNPMKFTVPHAAFVENLAKVNGNLKAKKSTTAPQKRAQPTVQPQQSDKFIITATELLKLNVTKLPTLVEGIIPKQGLFAIVGSSDVGKSTLARQLSICVATGTDWLGWKINATHNKVIAVSTEDDNMAIASLLQIQNNEFRFEINKYDGLKYVFDTSNLINNLAIELEKEPVDLIVIDTFSDVIGGADMNSVSAVRKYLNEYSQLSLKYKCAICFLHHTGKGRDADSPSKNNINGSQGFEAKMRLVMELRKDKADPKLRHLCVVKGNYLKAEEKHDSYVMVFDENMIFDITGERANMENLTGRSVKDEFDEEKHKKAIADIFTSNNTLSQRQLSVKLQEKLSVTEYAARKCIPKYEQQGWITNISDSTRTFNYKSSL